MSEIIYMRDNGDGGIELTDSDDPIATPYIRADKAEHIYVSASEKHNLFVEGDHYAEEMRSPCNTCGHHDDSELAYPCAACVHG